MNKLKVLRQISFAAPSSISCLSNSSYHHGNFYINKNSSPFRAHFQLNLKSKGLVSKGFIFIFFLRKIGPNSGV